MCFSAATNARFVANVLSHLLPTPGSIPVHLGDLDDLTSLSLDNNYLTGSLPAELFFDWDHLESLNLNRNALNGTIPPEISNAARLQSLRLQDNEFSGELPSQLQSLQRLQLLVRAVVFMPSL